MASLSEYPRMMEQWRGQAAMLRGVDGPGRPPVMIDLESIEAVLAYYDQTEARLLEAVQTRPIRIEVKTTTEQNMLIKMAVEQERRAILEKVLEAAPPLNAELNYDGSGDPGMAAYVEAWSSMWAIVNARLTNG